MGRLEDILLRIVECREKELPLDEIAKALEIAPATIGEYEAAFKQAFTSLTKKNLVRAAQELQMSPAAFARLSTYYSKFFSLFPSDLDKMRKRSDHQNHLAKTRTPIGQGKSGKEITEELIGKMRQYAEEGLSIRETAGKLNLCYNTIRKYRDEKNIKFVPGKRGRKPKITEELIGKMRQYAEEGLSSPEIARMCNINHSYLLKIARREGFEIFEVEPRKLTRLEIKILRHRARKENEERDKLIRRGLTLEQIGERMGYTRERARQLISASGQYLYWRESREGYTHPKAERQESENKQRIINALTLRVYGMIEHGEDDQFAERMSVKYKLGIRITPGNISDEKLEIIFREYHEAEKKGSRVSFEKIAEKVNMHPNGVRKILKAVGLKSLFWCIPYKSKIEAKKFHKLLEESESLPFNNAEVAYFLDVSGTLVGLHRKRRAEGNKAITYIAKGRRGKGTKHLTYKSASQIYEADDAGFNKHEITALLDFSERIVDYALKERVQIEPTILNGLRLLHPGKEISHPYL